MRALVVLAALALAGCAGDGPSEAPVPAGPAAIEAPTWTLGEYWEYQYSGTVQSGTTQSARIVIGDAGDHYTVGTDNPDSAWFDARFDISTMGPIRKADLAGSQGDGRVAFFDFPLEDGKHWSLTWDGIPFQATAVALDDGRYRIDYAEGGTVTRTIVYDANVRWFTSMAIQEGNGTFEARFIRQGDRWDGVISSWAIHDGFSAQGSGTGTHSMEIPEGTTDVWYQLRASCPGPAGSLIVRLGPVGAPAYENSQVCPIDVDEEGPLPTNGEDWQIVSSATQLEYHVEVMPRTLVQTTLP